LANSEGCLVRFKKNPATDYSGAGHDKFCFWLLINSG
jgi:hypothetical protein